VTRYFEPIAIVGGGNCARALACHFSSTGRPVYMLVRSLGPVRAIAAARGIRAVGRMDGEYPLEEVTDDPRRVCGAARDIVVATLATAYPEVMQALAPWLGPRHRVVLFSGKFGGSLIATRALRDSGSSTVPVLETDALFACRTQDDRTVSLRGVKQWNLCAAPRDSETLAHADFLRHKEHP